MYGETKFSGANGDDRENSLSLFNSPQVGLAPIEGGATRGLIDGSVCYEASFGVCRNKIQC